MIWTLVLFRHHALHPEAVRLRAARRRRWRSGAPRSPQSLEESERSREEAVKLLEEYRTRLAEARKEADELRERGRREGERQRAEVLCAGPSRSASAS